MISTISSGHVNAPPRTTPAGRCTQLLRPQTFQGHKAVALLPLRSPATRTAGPRKLVVLAASGGAGKRKSEEIPIFPLSVVALPSADVPLQIFEARSVAWWSYVLPSPLSASALLPQPAWL